MKKLKTLLAASAMSLLFSGTVLAAGWNQDGNGWWYENVDGSYAANGWQNINGSWYYFNTSGYMLLNTTTPDGYNVGADGAWVNARPQAPSKTLIDHYNLSCLEFSIGSNESSMTERGEYYEVTNVTIWDEFSYLNLGPSAQSYGPTTIYIRKDAVIDVHGDKLTLHQYFDITSWRWCHMMGFQVDSNGWISSWNATVAG